MHGWQGWLCLAWGLFVPRLGIAVLIWANIRMRRPEVKKTMLCMACLRFKFSPIHWLVRMTGICPGD